MEGMRFFLVVCKYKLKSIDRIRLSNSLKSCISWYLIIFSFEFGVGTSFSPLDNRLISSFESFSLDMFWMYLSFCCLRLLFLLSFWIFLLTLRDFDFDLGCSCVTCVSWFVSAFRKFWYFSELLLLIAFWKFNNICCMLRICFWIDSKLGTAVGWFLPTLKKFTNPNLSAARSFRDATVR